MSTTKILLFSNPRHGTTFLIDNINRNNNIMMCYELLSIGKNRHHQYHQCFNEIVAEEDLSLEDCEIYGEQRMQDETSYFNYITEKMNNIKSFSTIGYKIFAQQIDTTANNKVTLEYILDQFDKVIFLDRDVVSYAFSWVNAMRFGWDVHSRFSKDIDLVASSEDISDIIRQSIHKDKLFKQAHKYLDQSGKPYLDLNYDDLAQAPELISEFIGQDLVFEKAFEPLSYDYEKFLARNIALRNALEKQNKVILIDNGEHSPPVPSHERQNNKLEAINVLHTGNETQKETTHFINEIVKSFSDFDLDKDLATNIDFNITVSCNSTLNFDEQQIDLLKKLFKNVNILTIDIPVNKDFYFDTMPEDTSDINLEYGLKSGPNYIFFKTMPLMAKYNTSLFLEIDTYLKPGWLTSIANYVKHCGNFWINGTSYCGGAGAVDSDFLINHHINGGTCIYNTGNKTFQQFIEWCDKIFPILVKDYIILPYDYVVPLLYLIYAHYGHGKSWQIIRLAKQNYIYNNLICNRSLPGDIRKIKDPVPGYIIHEKLKLD